MAVIQIRTPNQGVVKVRIAGDTPTLQEEAAIKNEFCLLYTSPSPRDRG